MDEQEPTEIIEYEEDDEETAIEVALPWDRKPDEPSKWYERFLIYMNMGPSRTIQGAYRIYIGPERVAKLLEEGKHTCANSQWYYYCREWDWDGRAALYDDRNARKFLAQEEAIKQGARIVRIQAAMAGLQKAVDAIEQKTSKDMSKESVSALSNTVKQLSDLLRQDLEGFTETKRVQVEMLIAMLPPEVQEALSKKVRQ